MKKERKKPRKSTHHLPRQSNAQAVPKNGSSEAKPLLPPLSQILLLPITFYGTEFPLGHSGPAGSRPHFSPTPRVLLGQSGTRQSLGKQQPKLQSFISTGAAPNPSNSIPASPSTGFLQNL